MAPNLTRTPQSLRVFLDNIMESFRSANDFSLVLVLWAILVGLMIAYRQVKKITIWWMTPEPEPEPEYIPPPPPPTKREKVKTVEKVFHEQCELIEESPLLANEKTIGQDIMRKRLIKKMDELLQ